MENALVIFGLVLGIGAAAYLLLPPTASAATEGTTPTVSGTQPLTAAQIAAYAAAAGFQGGDLVTAVAVALAESSGIPGNYGDANLGGSYGLWQIYAAVHPEFGPDFTELYDPQTNADAAFQVYQAAGDTFTPWTTFKTGRYKNFLAAASAGVGA